MFFIAIFEKLLSVMNTVVIWVASSDGEMLLSLTKTRGLAKGQGKFELFFEFLSLGGPTKGGIDHRNLVRMRCYSSSSYPTPFLPIIRIGAEAVLKQH